MGILRDVRAYELEALSELQAANAVWTGHLTDDGEDPAVAAARAAPPAASSAPLHTAAMAHYDMLPDQPYAHEQAEVRGDSARRRVPRARPVSYREGCAGAQEAHRSCGGVGKGLSRRGRHRGIRSPAGL